jgi:hypothetical protein
MTEPADQYRRRADAFELLVAGTPPERWTSRSPCAEWSATDIVAHIVDFSARVLHEQAAIDDAPRFGDFNEPLDAFRATREQGWYGAAVDVPEDARLQDRVLGLLGRDPNWTAT